MIRNKTGMTSLSLAVLTAAVTFCALLSGCGSGALKIEDLAVLHEPEFGGVYIEITIDEFNKLGFRYGDSVKVSFSNGYSLEDVPYYSGYYVDIGQPLLVAYPGYDYIKAAVNYGADLWDTAGLEPDAGSGESFTASVYLNKRGKYLDIQQARDIHYSDERDDYPSDAVFANFRSVKAGSIAESTVFRSASPCDNQHCRAPYVDALISGAKVNCILDLADSDEKIQKYIGAGDFASPYFLSLYENGGVVGLAMSMNFTSAEFKSGIARGFAEMSEREGPYLIHCTEGKDRTGFVCMLLEALAGADYQQIADDYMTTYDNYYGITESSDKPKFDVILDKNLNVMIREVVGSDGVDIKTADLSGYARQYLSDAGMTDAQIDALLSRVTK